MATAYFTPLVSLPFIIDEPGKYVTRGGNLVTITKVSRMHDFNCCGFYDGFDIKDRWHKSGRSYSSVVCGNDIVSKAL